MLKKLLHYTLQLLLHESYCWCMTPCKCYWINFIAACMIYWGGMLVCECYCCYMIRTSAAAWMLLLLKEYSIMAATWTYVYVKFTAYKCYGYCIMLHERYSFCMSGPYKFIAVAPCTGNTAAWCTANVTTIMLLLLMHCECSYLVAPLNC